MSDLAELSASLKAEIDGAADLAALEAIRVDALGKKGRITERLKTRGTLSPDERKAAGQALNVLKSEIEAHLTGRLDVLKRAARSEKLAAERIDVTLPVDASEGGHIHPISQTIEELIQIFAEMGFALAE